MRFTLGFVNMLEFTQLPPWLEDFNIHRGASGVQDKCPRHDSNIDFCAMPPTDSAVGEEKKKTEAVARHIER